MSETDTALVLRAREGDRTAFEELVRRTSRLVFARLYLDTGRTDRADDLVQDALVRTLESRGQVSSGYLLRSIRNRFVDEYRRDRRNRVEPLVEGKVTDMQATRSVAAAVTARDGRLERALAHLSADDRAALHLWAVEEYSAREIAEIMGRPRGTILGCLWRSRRRLRKILSMYARVEEGGRE